VTPRRLIEPARLAGSTLLRTQSDARLVDLVRAGHTAAFEAIVHRYRRPLLAYCSRVLPASRAEDAVQQTFVSAHQAMTRDEADLNLRPWLYRIARNASLNLLRQNGWAHDELGENLDGVERPDEALERGEQLRLAVAAVNALPARQRDALVQRELEGKRYDEIAASMGVGDGAVRQLLHRARAALRAGASALTPVGLLERIADLAGGVGGGVGAAKLGAALLATGAVAGGTLATPIARHHHPQARVHAAAAPHRAKPKPAQTVVNATAPVVQQRPAVSPRRETRKPARSEHRGSGNPGPGNAGEDDPVEQEHSGKGGGDRRDSDDTVSTPAPAVDNSGSGSVSSGDGHSGSGDGGSGGSSGSGSGSSGSSGSGSSGSGSSGSGGGESGSSGSGSSGGDSGVSGSDGADDGH